MKNLKKIIAVFFAAVMMMSGFAISVSAAVSNTRYSVLVLDLSGSMDGSPKDQLKEATTAFCENVLSSIRSNNKVAIISFGSNTKVVCEFTDDLDKLKEGIASLYDGGGTYLAPALREAKDMLEKVDDNAIKNILVMSDGVLHDESASYDVVKSIPLHWNIYGFYFNHFSSSSSRGANAMINIGRNGKTDINSQVDVKNILYVFATEWSGQVTTKDVNNILVHIACPVDVYVTFNDQTLSKNNPQTTFGTLEITTDSKGEEIKTVKLAYNNEYDIKIEGYDTGEMDCSVEYFCNDTSLFNVNYPTVNVTDRSVITTHVDVDDAKINLDVDVDGDGIIDNQVAPKVSTSNFFYRIRNAFKEFFFKIREFFSRIFDIFKPKYTR